MIDIQVGFSTADGPADGPEDVSRDAAGDGPPGRAAAAWLDIARAAVEATLARRGVEVAEISLALLDDEAIRALNHEHLDHDRVTDVLSFALWSEGEPVLGDVYIGWRQAMRQAKHEGVPVAEEIARLAVHGTLHVLGFDHPEDAGARAGSEMYRLQEAIVAGLDVAAPHSADPDAAGRDASDVDVSHRDTA